MEGLILKLKARGDVTQAELVAAAVGHMNAEMALKETREIKKKKYSDKDLRDLLMLLYRAQAGDLADD